MEIPGFYYDKQKKKYFRIGSENSGQNLIENKVKAERVLDSINSYKRLDPNIHLPQSLHYQEINRQTKYNLKEELFRSQLKGLKNLKTLDIEMIDFCGRPMTNVCVESVISSPLSDNLWAVMSGDSGSVVYQISVQDINSSDFDINQSKQLQNCFPASNRVIDISYTKGSNSDYISTLVHHFDRQNVHSSYTLNAINESNNINPFRQVYEFAEPLFSATHFCDMNILGAEEQVYLFKPSYSGNIKIIPVKDKVTALKTDNEGKVFIMGTNNGLLTAYDIREDNSVVKRSGLALNGRSVVYLHILEDNRSLIASCHNSAINLIDLRMMDKPVLLYPNHVNECKKIPLSVDESVDIMCSSGDDNLVRFWSIKSGKMLDIYCPISINGNKELPYVENVVRVSYSHSWKCLNKRFQPLIFEFTNNKFSVVSNESLNQL